MESASGLVEAAGQGDEDAWHELVDRYNGLLWSIARAHGLGPADTADVIQTSWLRLVERLDTLRDPERVGAWLATTLRRECYRTLRRRGRQIPTDDEQWLEVQAPELASPVDDVLGSERDAILWRSVDALPERCRQLLRVLMADPPPSYEEVSAALDIPIGSIGPTRARCLERLRRTVELAGVGTDGSEEG